MTRRTRLFLAVTGGVLVLGIGAGVVASYYGFQGFTLATSDGPDELAYLPQDSNLVAYANVRDVMNSDLRRRLFEMRPADAPARNDFEQRTGINVERDIEMVVASFAGGDGDERPLVVARGSFDEARIEALIREQGGQVEDYRGERVFVVAEDDGDTQIAISFVEPGIMAVGTVNAVRSAIDTKATGASSVTENDELMALVRDMDEGTAWAVGRFDQLAASRLPEEVSAKLPPISWFAATGRVNGGLEALVRAETSTEQGAEDLRQVIQGFLALARLQSGQNPELAGLVNSLQLGGQGRTVSMTVSVPAELIELLGTANRLNRQNNPDPAPQP